MASRGFDVRLPAVPASVPAVRKMLRELLDRLDVSDERADEIVLAVNEACANAVVHAYPRMPGHIDVVVEDQDEALCVVVRDAGVGMAPAPNSPGLGLGLPMIAMVADSVRIDRPANGGTNVQMRFMHRVGHRRSGRRATWEP
jgi:serine/threonine-protein kinase RsbW/stage II sporulation protein AB (anti-sigma F factor)